MPDSINRSTGRSGDEPEQVVDFAFVDSGERFVLQPAANAPSGDGGFAVLVEALSILLAWPLPAIDAIVHRSDGADYHLLADPVARTWTATTDQDNYTTFSPERGLITVVNGGVEHAEPAAVRETNRRPGTVSRAAWLAFPTNLSIWGRHGDDWRIVDATKDEAAEQITLLLESLDEEWTDKVTGRVVIDTNRRIVTGLYVHAVDGDAVRYEELTQIRMPYRNHRSPTRFFGNTDSVDR